MNWGDRQAVADAPVWATPRVLEGGFVSGELMAQLQDGDVRNEYYLTPEGLDKLDRLLKSKCYRIRVPEHGALLMVAWLLNNGQTEEAHAILKEIGPYFHRLRFYPEDTSRVDSAAPLDSLFVRSVGEAINSIQKRLQMQASEYVPRFRMKNSQRKANLDWLPLKWKLLSFWTETCNGDGMPGECFPEGWGARALNLVCEFERLKQRDANTNAGRARKSSTQEMTLCIQKCLGMTKDYLSDHDKLCLKAILSGNEAKHSPLGSSEFASFQEHIRNSIPADETPVLNNLINRLAEEDPNCGLSQESIEKISLNFPKNLGKIVNQTRTGTLEELIKVGMVPSSEAMAALVPLLMARTLNNNIPDQSLRHLGHALDNAFSARRSVLLLSLLSQVRFDELPWAKPLFCFREGKFFQENVKTTMKLIVKTALEAFPQTVLPNKLRQSLSSLAHSVDEDIPLCDELAADIFMGRFSDC